jgi:hypothetical protein
MAVDEVTGTETTAAMGVGAAAGATACAGSDGVPESAVVVVDAEPSSLPPHAAKLRSAKLRADSNKSNQAARL